ncbi:MAG: tetratricopeptide repeat protein [Planctomycetota bacterium]
MSSPTSAPRNGLTARPLAANLSGWTWIVSPRWDLAYLVLPPLAVVPILGWLSTNWFGPEQISLVVIAFASLGHHLPGFLRAYGDSDLFARYRWRFLLAPPIAFGVALLFTPPAMVRETLGMSWTHLHGLELLLLFWGTWHGLMQTYGLMRIYDVRAGVTTPWSARLDHGLCLLIFTAGVVFSDTRVFGIGQVMAAAGATPPAPAMLSGLRITVASIGLVLLLLYTLECLRRMRTGEPLNPTKLLLAGVTGWFYWYCGRLTTNLAIGIAMFEVYHALQYNAIVWFYSRKRFQKAGGRFGLFSFLFSDRWTMLGVYLALIAAYGSLRLFTGSEERYLFAGSADDASQWLLSWFVASSMLHFYFDGFIWRVSEKPTQEHLVEGPTLSNALAARADSLIHLGKSAVLFAIIAGLLFLGVERGGDRERLQASMRELAELTPNVPDARVLLARLALAEGNPAAAAEHAEKGLCVQPRSAELLDDLAAARLQLGDYSGAAWAYRRLEEVSPGSLEAGLGRVAVQMAGGDTEAAVEAAGKLADRQPDDWRARNAYGAALALAEEPLAAHEELTQAAELAPSVAEPHVQLGLLSLRRNDPAAAIGPLQKAIELEPDRHDAHMLLGNALLAAGRPAAALESLETAWRLRRGDPDVAGNLGALLAAVGRSEEAETVYRDGLASRPDSATLRFNLGVHLWQQGRTAEARQEILAAEAAGVKLPPDVRRALSEE